MSTRPKTRIYKYPESDELTIVIRAAGERTQADCTQIIQNQLPDPAQLSVIQESPFSSAVAKTFQIGIDSGRPWLIAIDADIIPLDNAVTRIREICGKMDPRAFVATPLFLCNAVGGLATRGLHCYNAKYIQEAYDLIDTLDDDLRPESRVHDAMSARGYTRECYAKVLGLHEYEQSFKHIYLKAMLRSRKDEFREQIRQQLEARAHADPDARVALWGFVDAANSVSQPIEYDWDASYPLFDKRMNAIGWAEKSPIDLSSLNDFALDRINAHSFAEDTNTLPWIREILGFEDGAPDALAYVNTTPTLKTLNSAGTR
tara:strand:+ start:249506 stop:250453 length:948 start_codon:yes stop_codon:yes gene_type:complete